MKIKPINEYTQEEKTDLLFHWFRYYGKKMFTLEELATFMDMVETKTDGMFELAGMLYADGEGSTPIIDAFRSKDPSYLETLINCCKRMSKKDREENIHQFINEVVGTYNNPQAPIPIEESEFASQMKEIIPDTDEFTILNINIGLNSENVYSLLKDCMFRESEIKDDAPTKEFTFVYGIADPFVLSTERLNENKKKVAELIDMLQVSEIPQSFLTLCYDKHNNLWTEDQRTMEILLVLGIACDLIEYTCPREKWGELTGSVPTIIRTKKDISEPVVGEAPEAYSKYLTEEDTIELEKMKKDRAIINDLTKKIFNEHYKKAAPVLEMLGYSMGMEGEFYYLYDNKGEKLCELMVDPFSGVFAYEGVVNDTRVQYIHSKDGTNSDGSFVYRDIITVDNIQQKDGAYSGKQVKIELGVGQHEVPGVQRMEVTIIDPNSDEKKIKFYVNPYDLSLQIENNPGPYGNYENGTSRSVSYTNLLTTPYVNSKALLLHESQMKGNSYNISINRENTHPGTPDKYTHRTKYFKFEDRDNPAVEEYSLNERSSANALACEYLKTSRVKNLYNHILDRIDAEANGMKDFIHKNYPLTNSVEKIMTQTPASEQEELVNSFAIKDANVPSENGKNAKKQIKRN